MRKTASVAVAAVLTVAACGGGGSGDASDRSTPVARLAPLTGERTEVALDPAFVAGLRTLKLEAAPVGRATISAQGVASFPITGGNVTYYEPGTVDPHVQGLIHHDGSGLSLTGGGIRLELTDLDVDPGRSILRADVSANGTSIVTDAPLFIRDGRTLRPLRREGGTAVLEGTEVKLTRAAADLLNQTYRTTAVQEFGLVGVATITVTGPAA